LAVPRLNMQSRTKCGWFDASTFIKDFNQSTKLELTFTVSSDQFPDSSLKVLADFNSNDGKLVLTPMA